MPGTIPTFLESTATAECWHCWAPETEEPSDLGSLGHPLPLTAYHSDRHHSTTHRTVPTLTFDPKALDLTNPAGLHMNLLLRDLNVYMNITVGLCPLDLSPYNCEPNGVTE